MQEESLKLQNGRYRRLMVVFLLGFSSGLPLALTRGSLQAWLTETGVDIKTIGLFALVGYPYTFKFLWAPLMVRYAPNLLGGALKGWMVVTQLLLLLVIGSLFFFSPVSELYLIAIIALLISFLSASQDIAIDGYRSALLKENELGSGAGLAIMGYRIAMIVSGAGALLLATKLPWNQVYLLMAGIMCVGLLTTFWAPQTTYAVAKPSTLNEAVVMPFRDFFSRDKALLILLFVVLYKLGAVMALALETKFLLSLGFSKENIAYVAKGFGLTAVILGSMLGGALRDKLGERASIIWFGVFQAVSILLFSLLASKGPEMKYLSLSMGIENFCSGLSQAALTAYLMNLCNREMTTTQFALLSSLTAIPPVICASLSGYFVEALGWEQYFVFCAALSLPGLLIYWGCLKDRVVKA